MVHKNLRKLQQTSEKFIEPSLVYIWRVYNDIQLHLKKNSFSCINRC